jgi:cold shock CspA family protein
MTEPIRTTGRIKTLVRDRGYGFVTVDAQPGDAEQSVFFHRSALAGDGYDRLAENDAVSLIVEDSPKGKRANAVNII